MIILVPFWYFHFLYIVLPDNDPAGPRHVGSIIKYSRTPLIQINWDDEQSGYTKNIWIIGFFFEKRLYWQCGVEKNFYKWLF